MKVLALGGGFHNKGAEAMLLTLSAFLHRRFPGCEVAHLNGVPDWNARFEAAGVSVLPPWPYVSRKVRIPEFWKDMLHLPLPAQSGLRGSCYEGFTVALDISGFKSSDQWESDGRERWWEVHLLKGLGAPVIFMPQAWGPFERPAVRRYTRLMLRGAPLVFAREAESLSHLRSLKVLPPEALQMASDIALQFQPAGAERGDALLAEAGLVRDGRPLIGVAPNIKVYERAAGEGTDNAYVRFLAGACRRLVDACNAQIVVIPHGISRPGVLDDIGVGRHLCATPGLAGSIGGVWRDCPAADLKALIGRLDYLVASRFHALVAAVSMRIPAFAIGWSHKYAQLVAEAGTAEDRIGLDGLDAAGVDLVVEGWERRGALREALCASVPAMEQLSRRALDMAGDWIEQHAR